MWVFKTLLWANEFSQTVHWYGFSPVWERMWHFKLLFWLNDLPQTVQWYGFSPVWVRMCVRSKQRAMKILSHIVQRCRFWPEWMCMWVVRVQRCENDLSHSVQRWGFSPRRCTLSLHNANGLSYFVICVCDWLVIDGGCTTCWHRCLSRNFFERNSKLHGLQVQLLISAIHTDVSQSVLPVDLPPPLLDKTTIQRHVMRAWHCSTQACIEMCFYCHHRASTSYSYSLIRPYFSPFNASSGPMDNYVTSAIEKWTGRWRVSPQENYIFKILHCSMLVFCCLTAHQHYLDYSCQE